MHKMYTIRDNSIPLGKIKDLEQYLIFDIFNEKRSIEDIIAMFYGCAISANNIRIIALLNLFVRENNLKLNKSNIIDEIYYADFRKEYQIQLKKYGCRLELGNFTSKIEYEYIYKYWKMMDK